MLSQGPFNYNRFDALQEKAKPDFLDMDKDGDKKESMKKAVKEKGGKCDDCGKKDCGCDDKKKDKGKGKPPWLKEDDTSFIELDYAEVSKYLWEKNICQNESEVDYWLDNASQTTLDLLSDQINENRAMANGGHPLVGDGSKPKAPRNPKNKVQTMMGKDGKPLFKEDTIVKEDVMEYMVNMNMVTNSVSAEALFNHISDEFLEEIEEAIMEGMNPKAMGKISKMAAKMANKKKGY